MMRVKIEVDFPLTPEQYQSHTTIERYIIDFLPRIGETVVIEGYYCVVCDVIHIRHDQILIKAKRK